MSTSSLSNIDPAAPAFAPPAPPALSPTLSWLVDRAGARPDPAAPLRLSTADPGAYAQALIDAGRAADAIRLVACALPPREGVWWAWVSARHASQPTEGAAPTPAVADALAAVERWISQPTDDMRRSAWTAGQAAGLESPAGAAAAAAYFSTGSLAPPDAPLVPTPPGLHSFMIAAAVTLAAAADPEHLATLAAAYIAQALEIVKQLGGWDRATAAAREYHEAQRAQHERASAPPAREPGSGSAATGG